MHESQTRRGVLGAIGGSLAVGIAGCLGNSGGPRYERRTVDVPADAEPRTTAEITAATQQATTTGNDAVVPTTAVDLTDHEFVYEPGYLGATVQGTVVNRAEDRIDNCEVRVRVYDDAGRLLGRYLDGVSELDGGQTWRFTAIILEAPTDIAAYEIAALATPA